MGSGKGGRGGGGTTTTRVEPVIPAHLRPFLDEILGAQQNLFNSQFPSSLRPGPRTKPSIRGRPIRGGPDLQGTSAPFVPPPFGFVPPQTPQGIVRGIPQ